MKPRQNSPKSSVHLRIGLLAALLTLCMAAVPNVFDFRSTAQGQIQVTAADPTSTEQGTVNLNVRVTGKGFKSGAQAQWFVTGTTNPGGVTVNSTSFVSSTELIANITVDETAVIANFDIQVLNKDGRGGKGTELFAVTSKQNQFDGAVRARFVYCAPPGSDPDSQAVHAACIQQNRIRNDVDRDYVDGEEEIGAGFAGVSNDLTINLLNAPTRRTVIDLYDLIPESSGQLIPSWRTTPQYATWHLNVRQAYLAKTFCGGSYPCDMTTGIASTVKVSGDSATYHLHWKPDATRPVNSPEITSPVNVRYDIINGVETWTITPLPNVSSGRIVAGLAKATKRSLDAAGQYIAPFTLTVRLK